MRVLLHDDIAPQRADDAVQRHVLLDGVGAQPAVGVAADQVKRPDHRLVRVVVGAEVESGQQVQHRAPIMAAVGAADRGAERRAVGGAGRLALAHQVVERLLAHHGEQHLTDGAVRLLDGGAGQIEQQALLAADTLKVVQRFLLDLVLRTGADVMHGLDIPGRLRRWQQVDQGVGDGASAQVRIGGKPHVAGRLGVAAQLVGRFDADALAARVQLLLAPVGEQVGGQAELVDHAEPGQLVAQAGDAGTVRAGAQVNERGVCPAVRNRLIVGSFGALGTNRLQQGIEPGTDIRQQTAMDHGMGRSS